MFTAAMRCLSNALAGCCIRKLTRTTNGSSSNLKAAVTTALLFIMGALYCLYGIGGSTGVAVTTIGYGQQVLGSSDSIDARQNAIAVVATMDGGNSHMNLSGCGKKHQKKQKKGIGNVLTAADMYETGFRIRNAGLCSARTRLLVLITSAAAPSHSQNRQAIRMTWMNRYGPGVSMAFLVGTPQMSETDPVAQLLKAEEQALKVRLNRIGIKNNNPKEKPKPPSLDGKTLGGDPGWYRFLRDREPNPGEGLDAQAMHGLNDAEQAVQRILGREHGRFGDIVQCHSRDTYTNLTLKSIAALEWTRQYCPSARYLLKTDDDMFIDIRRLLRFIDKVETEAITETSVNGGHMDTNNFAMGADMFESAAASDLDIELPPTIWGRLAHGWRPIRQLNSKYYVSRTQYAGRVYPDFCTGPAYLMTRSAISPLYEAALGRDFAVIDDDEDEDDDQENKNDDDVGEEKDRNNSQDLGKDCGVGNQTLGDKVSASVRDAGKNTVPYLKLEDVYLTGVVAERLSLRAAERLARLERKAKKRIPLGDGVHDQKTSSGKRAANHAQVDDGKNTILKASDIIVKVRRIHDDQFANKKITGRALERAVCSGVSPGDTAGTGGTGGFSWFRWYWGDTTMNKESKKKKKDQGVISLHMVKYFEQFDLWRRLMDGRTKCKP